jgi:uncharacterized protein
MEKQEVNFLFLIHERYIIKIHCFFEYNHMSIGLLALLDDIAAIVKATAASLDDIAAQAAKAGAKAAGVVIDDAAVTPKYVVGLSPKRELPIIWNIAKGSLKNKFLFLLPAALLLGWLAPWAIQPLLAAGGLFLCFEGYEKLHSLMHAWLHRHQKETLAAEPQIITPEALEQMRTASAIRTDFILSAEIMAISYAIVVTEPFFMQAVTLAIVAVGMTVLVYGFVAIIVKADDVGLYVAQHGKRAWLQSAGRTLVRIMPGLLKILGYVGTAAMLWVGGGIIIHSVPFLHHVMEGIVHTIQWKGFAAWVLEAVLSGIFGIAAGYIVVFLLHSYKRFKI